ncbi:hypothetical protein Tco_0018501 [Tanacetum coccineum]
MATERLDADLQGTPTDQTTYHRMIGGLMYLTASHPDIAFATFVCARYQAHPTVKHLKEVKRIFRYLRQSYNTGLWYPKDSGFKLIAYSDADHEGCKDDCKSTSGGKVVSWSSKKQDYTAISTAEAEYVSFAIAISCNPVQHSKTKHIDIRYHFIKEHVEKGTVELYFVSAGSAMNRNEIIIMAQQQHAADVHPDELCPPNKRYDLMDANKKVDLDHVQCPPESKILTNIIKNHPLRFSIAASSSVPWIYMAYIGIYNGVKDTIEFQDYWSSAAMANVMQNILQMLNNTCHWMGPTAVADNANDVLLLSITFHVFAFMRSSYGKGSTIRLHHSYIFDSISHDLHRSLSGPDMTIFPGHLKTCSGISIPRNDEPNIPGTRIEPKRNKESPEVKLTKETLVVEITNVVIPVNARFMPRKSFDTLADNLHDVMVETLPTMVDKYIKEQVAQISTQIENVIANVIPSQVDASVHSYMSGHILHVHLAQSQTSFVPDQQYQLYLAIKADPQLQQQDIAIWLALQMKFERNTDLLYLKKGNSRPEKIVLSLHKFPAIIFNDDDIEEQTSRWVNKCVKKFNPYARYGVEHWKNPHAKIFYIRKQKELGKSRRDIISNSKIPDYKNLNKNVIEDINLLIMNVIWERVHDFQLGIESYQQKVNLTAPTMTFPGIEDHEMFSIIYEPMHGIIYKNIKKEKRMMRHSEIHKFCDATLNRVLEGLKSYNNDVKYGYVQKDLTKEEAEYLKLFEEEIKERLKHRRQMRRQEIGSTTSPADSFPSLTPFETSDSLLEEFADELALLDPFLPENKNDNFDPEADLREIEYLLNRDPSTDSLPKTNIYYIYPFLGGSPD